MGAREDRDEERRLFDPVGEKLRVSVRLVTPETEESKWAASYDRGVAAMLDLPSEIARGVATTLAGGESAAAAGSLARRVTANPEAYDSYLKGNFYFAQRSAPALNLAVANYRRAFELDPTFAAARARIAMCYGQMIDYEWLPAGTEAMVIAQGIAQADTALRTDSTSADAWVAVGYLHYLQPHVDRPREVAAYQQVIRFDRNHIEANQRLAWAMLFAGDYAAQRHTVYSPYLMTLVLR